MLVTQNQHYFPVASFIALGAPFTSLEMRKTRKMKRREFPALIHNNFSKPPMFGGRITPVLSVFWPE
jgi:hypothetical protein